MTTNAAKVKTDRRPKLLERFADRFGVEPEKVLTTLKATAFKTKKGEVSNEELMALVIVAEQYSLNPWTKEIYAFPDKHNGIVPIVSVDGWLRILNEHESFDGMDFTYSDEVIESKEHKPCPAYITCTIHRRDRTHPIVVTEYLDECYRPPFKGDRGDVVGPWQTHTKRMLRHKAMIQCARIAFGFTGIYDPDEAERIREGVVIDAETTDDATDLNRELQLTNEVPV